MAEDAVSDQIEPTKIWDSVHFASLDVYVVLGWLARDRAKKRLVTDCAVVNKVLFHIGAISS